jgi:hypothetical protein
MQPGFGVTCHWHFPHATATCTLCSSPLTTCTHSQTSLPHSRAVEQRQTLDHDGEDRRRTRDRDGEGRRQARPCKKTQVCTPQPVYGRSVILTTLILHRLGGDIITVLVGPKATAARFFVHSDLVSQHSDFFQACLKKGWKEAEERIVRLPDLPGNSATAFEDFHSFLYTGKVYSAIEGEVNRPNADGEWGRLVGAWILGEVLLSGSFKDAVSDAILDKLNTGLYYPTSLFCSAYKYGSANSAFRRLMVDIAVYHWDDDTMSKLHTERDQAAILPFYQSIAVALLQWKQQPEIAKSADSPTKLEGTCFYHEHGDKPCYKTMF